MSDQRAAAASPWRTSRWWLTTALVLAGIVACLVLGGWQYDRARTRDTPAGPSNPMAAAPLPLEQVVPADDRVLPGTDPTAVTVAGEYDAEHSFLVPGRVADGQPVAYVVTPLLRGSLPAVLVVRGWVPESQVPSGPPPAPVGQVTLTGWLAPSEPLDASTLDPLSLPDGQVSTLTAARMLSRVGYPLVDGYLGLVSEQREGRALQPTVTPLEVPLLQPGIRWSVQSLSYAIEWWFFAIAGVWMWWLALRIERRRLVERDAAQPAATAPPSG